MTRRELLFGEIRGLVGRGDREAFEALTRLVESIPDDDWMREVLEPYLAGAMRLGSWARWAVELDTTALEDWRTPSAGVLTRVASGLAVLMIPAASALGERVLTAPPSAAARELRWSDTYLWREDIERLVASAHAPRLESLCLAHNAMDVGSYDALGEGAHRFSQLTFLDIDNSAMDEQDLSTILRAPWPALVGLDLARNPCGAAALELLADLGWSERIERLDARAMGVTGSSVDAFLASAPERLARLDLSGASLGAVGVEAFTYSNLLALKDLVLDGTGLGVGAGALASAAWWPRLESVSLTRNGLLSADVQRLFVDAHETLEVLTIANNPIGEQAAVAVVRALSRAPIRALYMQRTDAGDEGARAIAEVGWSGLETLFLWSCGVTARGARSLASAPFSPREIDLGQNDLGAEGARALAAASWLDGLEILRLPRNALGSAASELAASRRLGRLEFLDLAQNDLGAHVCASLGANPSLAGLKTLRLESNPLGDEGAAALARGGALSGIESLFLWDCGIGDDGAHSMAVSAPWFGLKVLNLNRNSFGSGGVRALANAPWAESLEALHLYEARFQGGVGAEGVTAIAASPVLGRLQTLELGQSGMGGAGFEALVGSETLRGLRDLDVSRCNLERGGLSAIEGARWSCLWRLMLWGNTALGPEDAAALGQAASLDRLAVLNMNQCAIGAAGVHAILDSPGLEALRALHVNGARMGDEAMMRLLGHPRLSRLSALNVSENFQGVAVARAMAESWGMRTTRMLYCSRNGLGDEGVSALAVGSSMHSMRFIELQGNGVGEAGARALANSPVLELVETLDLSNNPLGDAGIFELTRATSLKSLLHLKLSGCEVGDEGAQTLASSELLTRLDSLTIDRNAITAAGIGVMAKAPRLAPSVRESLEAALEGY